MLIVGAGGMAAAHADAYAAIPGVEISAVVEPDPERRAAFCSDHGIDQGFADLDTALAWDGFDAASNVTPDNVHYPTTMPLLAAGKHVLCEKPLATTHAHARGMQEAAERAGVIAMVNLTYRKVPALARAREMVAEGQIGALRHFEASYLQSWLVQPAWGAWRTSDTWLWRLSTDHGSAGVLGDVGVHILDFLTHIAGEPVMDLSCRLKTFPKVEGDQVGDYKLDANDSLAMTLTLKSGAMGVVHASRFAAGHINDLSLKLHGTDGALDVRFLGAESRLSACLGRDMQSARWRAVRTETPPTNFETFISAIRGECPADPGFATGAELQHLLDLAARSAASSGKTMPAR